jgi:hypothetical protein
LVDGAANKDVATLMIAPIEESEFGMVDAL